MARTKWRVRKHENDGRWYPEYTTNEGETWRIDFVIARKQGYAREHYARKFAQDYIDRGVAQWWEEKTVQEQLGPEVVAALTAKFEGRQAELEDDIKTEEQIKFTRRAEFIRWLIEHDKLGADDNYSEDSRLIVQPGLLVADE
jgi:hypothetical protein